MNKVIELIEQLESIHPDLYKNYDRDSFYKESKKICK